MDFVRINSEVYERTLLETEDRRVGVAVLPVLTDGIAPVLPSHRILEFAGGYRHAVERKGPSLRYLPCSDDTALAVSR